MTITPEIKEILVSFGVYSIALAAIFTGIFVAYNGWRDRAATNKRHLREQALKLAMEQWLQETKAANVHMMSGGSSMQTQEYHGPPARDLHEIVFRALKFVDAFSKNEVTEENLPSFYSKPQTEE